MCPVFLMVSPIIYGDFRENPVKPEESAPAKDLHYLVGG